MKRFLCVAIFLGLSTGGSLALSVRSDPFSDMRLPQQSFTNASLSSVAKTLEREYNKLALKYGRSPQLKIILHPSCTNMSININVNKLSVQKILDILNCVYGIQYTLIDSHVLLHTQNNKIMTHRIYNIQPSAFGNKYLDVADVTEVFKLMGCSFTKGSSAIYLPGLCKLIVYNTGSTFEALEKVLKVMNVACYQVETVVRVIRVDDHDLAEQLIQSIYSSNAVNLIAECDTVYLASNIGLSGTSQKNSLEVSSNSKSSGGTDASTYFILVPMVNGAGTHMTMSIIGSLMIPLEKYGKISYEIDSHVMMKNGATMIFRISPPVALKADSPVFIMLVSAHLIDLDGKRLKKNIYGLSAVISAKITE